MMVSISHQKVNYLAPCINKLGMQGEQNRQHGLKMRKYIISINLLLNFLGLQVSVKSLSISSVFNIRPRIQTIERVDGPSGSAIQIHGRKDVQIRHGCHSAV